MLVQFSIPSTSGLCAAQSVVATVIGFRAQGLDQRWIIDARAIQVDMPMGRGDQTIQVAEVSWKSGESLLDIAGRTVRVFGLKECNTFPPIS